jgi:proton-translocating NADH-quinone oxidoreductase chain L
MDFPLPALLLTIAVLLPLAAFLLLTFVGKRMGTPLAGIVGTAFIAGSFVCSLAALFSWSAGAPGGEWGYGKSAISRTVPWIPIGTAAHPNGINQETPGFLDVGVYVDSLTVVMFCMITLVATLVHIFSIGYMREDKRFPRFFTYLGLFCFSMLGLVIGGTTLQLFIFWELVGLCSYLLIGFWYEKKSASDAAMKAFIVNRVGDFGFLIGFGILFCRLGNVTLPRMWIALAQAGTGHAITLPGGTVFTTAAMTVMGIGLFFGAVGKSAQFPLHVWLPDAMEGPTPVSALIHAATMVAAGVYLVGRLFPILTPDAKLFIAIIGVTTLTMAALIAIVQSDIKKILAYSTLSQLGYMIMALGLGSWVGGLFHLITHAFFKALLFLGSGSVIHAAHHEQELPQYGGLLKKIPVTGYTFLAAVLAISGVGFAGVGFSGYYSKDMILKHAGAFATMASHAGLNHAYWLFFILPTIIAYVTAFYMTRCWSLTFLGKPRNQHLYDHAHEEPIMWVPLVVLAILSVVGGRLLLVQDLLENSVVESSRYCTTLMATDPFYAADPTFRGFDRAWPTAEPADETAVAPDASGASTTTSLLKDGESLVLHWVQWAFIVGIGAGLLMYSKGYAIADQLMKIPPLKWIHTWLYRRMYFDELYKFVFVETVRDLLSGFSGWFDRNVVDGLVNGVAWVVKMTAFGAGLNDKYVVDGAVNGAGALARDLGTAARAPQTGRIRIYVTVFLITAACGLAAAIFIVIGKG